MKTKKIEPQNKQKINWRKYLPFYLMTLPALIYIFINNYIPMFGIILAFKDYKIPKGVFGSKWNGINNFKFLFKSPDAWNITRNTILYNLVFIILGMVFAIFVAILLNEIKGKVGKNIFQTCILIPYLVSIVVVSYIVNAFLDGDNGFVNNHILNPLGLESVPWYESPQYWPFILVFVNLWKNFGYQSIIFVATIAGFDQGMYEAAAVDGANKWQQIWRITIPCLVPTIITLSLMAVGRIFFSDFGLFYQVPGPTSGSLIEVTSTIDTYVYRGLKAGSIGMSAAAGLYQAVVGFILILTANGVTRKLSKEHALF